MKKSFNESLESVLEHEGGFANHPKDPGGATMKGVTLAVFKRFYGADKTVSDLKKVTKKQLQEIYRTDYWDKCRCDSLPSGVDYAVFDSAVNSGPGRAAVWLQGAVGAVKDGGIGPNTIAKVATHEPVQIINDTLDQRMTFLRSLRTFSTFGRGWTRRVTGVRQVALTMAGAEAIEPPQDVAPDVDFDIVKIGSRGPWVTKLQEALGITADGAFGPKTEGALKGFQEGHGLVADGIAGRNTYRALGLIS